MYISLPIDFYMYTLCMIVISKYIIIHMKFIKGICFFKV